MNHFFRSILPGKVKLLPGIFQQRFTVNRRYLLSLRTENLLQNHYLEAGLWHPNHYPEDIHWGWESPTSQVRGHFLGHWLSAASLIYANTGDAEIKGKADFIVSELARCQKENGGEWAGSIPEKYLDWAARGKSVWAPHYTLHKTLMGLYDMYAFAGNREALEILLKWAHWFHHWISRFSAEQRDDILDVETGGMLESWANLYGVTGEKEHLELMQLYDRRRLFEPLLEGKDVLTNMHANTTIPEVQGAARAWEVTGDERWRKIVEAYWKFAVTDRGYFCTGGQTNGEIWTPPFEFAACLGDTTQEHCTVYNMMRLADYLHRWTGEISFADYWERNLYNGILAQQHPETGMIAYFLPLRAGCAKVWGTPGNHFWCCHGTLVQAHTVYANHIYYEDDDGLVLNQYIPSVLSWERNNMPLKIALETDHQLTLQHRPNSMVFKISIKADTPVEFTLKIRIPWWVSDHPAISVNDQNQETPASPSSYLELKLKWQEDSVNIVLPKKLTTSPLPDEPDTIAFMDGPVVLAGLHPDENLTANSRFENHFGRYPAEKVIFGDKEDPQTILIPDNEREWIIWQTGKYRTRNQPQNLHFIPLYEVRDERYQVYFPIKSGN